MANMETPGGQRRPQPSSTPPNPAATMPPKPNLGWGALVGLILVVAVIGLGGYWVKQRRAAQAASGGLPGQRGPGGGPVPVIGGMVSRKDVPIYLDGLGNVQAFNTVAVRARVDGQVEKIAFVE